MRGEGEGWWRYPSAATVANARSVAASVPATSSSVCAADTNQLWLGCAYAPPRVTI